MKETPILFTSDMSRAIRELRKTQTRRVIKTENTPFLHRPEIKNGKAIFGTCLTDIREYHYVCPFGKPGDRLWIKETHYLYGKWVKNFLTPKTLKPSYRFVCLSKNVLYPDSKELDYTKICKYKNELGWFKRSSIFMPRWASRTIPVITDIRIERVQDISEEDAIKEGVTMVGPAALTNRTSFARLWDTINAKRGYGWNMNPWNFVIEFKVIS